MTIKQPTAPSKYHVGQTFDKLSEAIAAVEDGCEVIDGHKYKPMRLEFNPHNSSIIFSADVKMPDGVTVLVAYPLKIVSVPEPPKPLTTADIIAAFKAGKLIQIKCVDRPEGACYQRNAHAGVCEVLNIIRALEVACADPDFTVWIKNERSEEEAS